MWIKKFNAVLGVIVVILVWVSIGLFITNNVADAIYFLLVAVLINQGN